MKDITLVIMAAGMGSRYGGLKQIDPVGPAGEIILDYSVYDAIKAGFTKIVFLIKEENYEIFNKYRTQTGWMESAPILWKKDKLECIKKGYFFSINILIFKIKQL